MPHGNKTKSGLTNTTINTTATHIDLTGLSGILEYDPDEFVFTALAGTPSQISAKPFPGTVSSCPLTPRGQVQGQHLEALLPPG